MVKASLYVNKKQLAKLSEILENAKKSKRGDLLCYNAIEDMEVKPKLSFSEYAEYEWTLNIETEIGEFDFTVIMDEKFEHDLMRYFKKKAQYHNDLGKLDLKHWKE